MATKVKKISINELERCVKENNGDAVVTKEWHGIDLVIKRRLSLPEMMRFVDGTVKSCFVGESLEYTPEVKDFVIRCNVLTAYANFTLPSNIEKRYDLVYGCDAYRTVLDNIDYEQFDDMLCSIDEKISHLAQANIEAIAHQMNGFYAALDGFESRLSNAFGNIDSDAISQFITAVSDGKLDEGKLVQAYLNSKHEQPDNLAEVIELGADKYGGDS